MTDRSDFSFSAPKAILPPDPDPTWSGSIPGTDYRPGTVVCLEPTGAGDWRIVGLLGPALL
jgi:hypothetical protein